MPRTAPKQCSPVVYLVDDDRSILRALTLALEAEGFEIRAFASPRRFLTEHDRDVPGCVVLDLAMPDVSGLEIQRSIASLEPSRPIIFISGKNDIAASVTAMKNGAVDFLTKPLSNAVLIQTIKEAIGKDQAARRRRDQALELKERFLQLTARERKVFSHVLSGKLNKQIAWDLGITEKTAKTHRARAMRKMRAKSLAELAHFGELLKPFVASLDEWQNDQATF